MSPIEPQTLQTYIGQYQLGPNVTITINAENKRMFSQITGIGNFELYPKFKTNFFFKHIDGEITFNKDTGKGNRLNDESRRTRYSRTED